MTRMVYIKLVLCVAFGCFVSCASESGNTLRVSLQTDLVAKHEFSAIELSVLPLDGQGEARRMLFSTGEQSFSEMDIVGDLTGLSADDYRLRLTVLSPTGLGLTVRPTIVSMQGDTAVGLRVARSCLEVDCGDEQACLDGQCVDLRCHVGATEFCAREVICTSHDDCSTGAACAEALCEEGVCWSRANGSENDQACDGDTSWCHPESGCTPVGEAPSTPTCEDGQQNQGEQGIDCGGPCARCIGVFSSRVADHCVDAFQNQDEQGIDCGGECTPCPEDDFCVSQSAVPMHECLALRALYEANDPALWVRSRGWFTSPEVCEWEGLVCEDGHLSEINEPNSGLDGTLPPEIGNLRNLERFHIRAQLTGTIPPEVAKMSALTAFSLFDNALEGTLPPELWTMTQLETLSVGINQLSGTLSPEIAQLTGLNSLELRANDFEGTLPSALGELRALTYLDVSGNDFEGELPTALGELTGLGWLALSSNSFSGTIPAFLGELSLLEGLELDNNAFVGTLPPAVGNLPLVFFVARGNQLEGPLPSTFATLTPSIFLRIDSNSCLWAEDCATQAFLDNSDPDWQSSNTSATCSPPPLVCP